MSEDEMDPLKIGALIHEVAAKGDMILITGGGAMVLDLKTCDRRFLKLCDVGPVVIVDEFTEIDKRDWEAFMGLIDKIEVPHIDALKAHEETHPPRRSKGDRKRNKRYRWCD